MHDIQTRLLALAQHDDIASMSLRKVGERLGVRHAAQVRHHLNQLIAQGLLVKNAAGSLVAPNFSSESQNLFSIPFMGEADCGEATMIASGQIQGYLSISPRLTHFKDVKGLYALQARGDSMNRADVKGKTIEDSDYVLVKPCEASELIDGDYVVSILNGLANIKSFHVDSINKRIILTAKSSKNHPPIMIASDDMPYYKVSGKVVDVIKGIGHLE